MLSAGNAFCLLQEGRIRWHTHTRLTALCPGLPGWAGTKKVNPIWILLKEETVSGSGISWAICKSALSSRQITMPAPHRSVFLQAGCPSGCPTNSVKALKGLTSSSSYCLTRRMTCVTLLAIVMRVTPGEPIVQFNWACCSRPYHKWSNSCWS